MRPTTFSILRCPGSKGWFVPYAGRFVRKERPKTIVEPFAGSAIVGLTLLDHGHGQQLLLAEKDPELLQIYQISQRDAWLGSRVRRFSHELWAIEPQRQLDFAIESSRGLLRPIRHCPR